METFKKLVAFFGWAFAALFAFMFLAFVVLIVAVSQIGVDGSSDFSALTTKSEHAVGVVELSGEILTSKGFRKKLKKLVENDSMKAIVVRIDSPGGAVGASEEIYRYIRLANEKKPVVCSLANVAASGGLYAAVGCQKIVTNAGTLTGSIGVIMMMPNLEQLVDKAGFSMNVVKSGRFKDTGSPFRAFTGEDKELLQSLVNKTYEQFVSTIATSRGLELDVVKKFADGRIILGEQALEYGLVDEIGGLARAAKIALELTGDMEEPEIVIPKKPGGFLAIMEDLTEVRLLRWIRSYGKVRLLYQAYS